MAYKIVIRDVVKDKKHFVDYLKEVSEQIGMGQKKGTELDWELVDTDEDENGAISSEMGSNLEEKEEVGQTDDKEENAQPEANLEEDYGSCESMDTLMDDDSADEGIHDQDNENI